MLYAWFKAALVRALKTMAQTALATVTVGMTLSEVEWPRLVSVSLAAGIFSLLTSVAGLPEVEDGTPLHELKGDA